jgi:hypothetical protein
MDMEASMDSSVQREAWAAVNLTGVFAAIWAAAAVCLQFDSRHQASPNHARTARILHGLPVKGARESAQLFERIVALEAAIHERRSLGRRRAKVLAKRVHLFLAWAAPLVASTLPPK